jgi:stage II sporulation protein D
VVKGRGFGHGLGLSQWGAYYLAKQGINYHQILAHYYQTAHLSRMKQ